MTIKHVGFSGSADAITDFQMVQIGQWLQSYRNQSDGEIWLHHGGAVVSDDYAHGVAKEIGYKIHLHPPLNQSRSVTNPEHCDKVDPPYSYYGRNHRIAIACQVLIAAPFKATGGGTWNTIGRVVSLKKPHVIVYKDHVTLHGVSPWEIMK